MTIVIKAEELGYKVWHPAKLQPRSILKYSERLANLTNLEEYTCKIEHKIKDHQHVPSTYEYSKQMRKNAFYKAFNYLKKHFLSRNYHIKNYSKR